MYIYVLSVVGMVASAGLVALRFSDLAGEQTERRSEMVTAEVHARSIAELALERIRLDSDWRKNFADNPVIAYRTGTMVLTAYVTDSNGNKVDQSLSNYLALWVSAESDAGTVSSWSMNFTIGASGSADPSPANPSVTDRNPLAYWPLSERAGTHARDVVGSAHGVYADAAEPGGTVSPIAYAPTFDGTGAGVEIQHADWMLLDELTIAFWFRVDAIGRNQTVLAKDASGAGNGGHFSLDIAADGEVSVAISNLAGNEGRRTVISSAQLELSRWYHFACTVQTSDRVRIYIDGVETNEILTSYSWGPAMNGVGNTEPLLIGAGQSQSIAGTGSPTSNPFRGAVSDLAIFDTDLSNSKIDDLMASGDSGASEEALSFVPGTWVRLAR